MRNFMSPVKKFFNMSIKILFYFPFWFIAFVINKRTDIDQKQFFFELTTSEDIRHLWNVNRETVCFCSVSLINLTRWFLRTKFCYLVWSLEEVASPWDLSRYDSTSFKDLSRYSPDSRWELSRYKVNIYFVTRKVLGKSIFF